ncbi:MAG: S9 family peptidase [Flavobacteriaceae bacterium]|nr:S9 family peptidase [Flavobacteriaceae bacterium]MDG2414835.1 S9 family peptidase [Flavobacteriaceae bacterium]
MRKIAVLFSIGLLAINTVLAQEKEVSVAAIYDGTFRTEGMDVLRSRNNGTQYTLLNYDRVNKIQTIDLYEYETLEKTATLLSTEDLEGISYMSSYTFSADESKVLLATDLIPIYRRSTLGSYFVYDFNDKSLIKIANVAVQEPSLSPDGSKVAYGYENNIYLFDLKTKQTEQLTFDGEKNRIINGITDWVYEEEFGFVRAFEWSPEGTHIAFLRFDETEVPEYSMPIYGEDLYPTLQTFKYPKAGENNAVVSLHLIELEGAKTSTIPVDAYYIPRIMWKNNPDELAFQTFNRHQNELVLYEYNKRSGALSVLHTERDAAYVDVNDNLTFLVDDSFIWSSEKDGYNHLYLHDKSGKEKRQLTSGDWEVTSYYGYDEKCKKIFFQSTAMGSINRDVYSVGINGKNATRLTAQDGVNRASFSADFTYFINAHSNAATPPSYTLNTTVPKKRVRDANAGQSLMLKTIVDNTALLNTLEAYNISPKEFSTLAVNGNDLNMWMIKPADFDPSKKYPLLMFQYSGPGSQSVSNTWMGANDYWYQLLQSRGYVIACVDGRGTGFKGRDFKKSTYLQLVRYESDDQIAAAEQLSALPYIDENRTGIWGWSFGGDMAMHSILKGNEVFETAISVAPVTSWRFYDTIYTERFMRTPQENPEGYDLNSPLNYAERLKGKLLLVHGSADDNVHFQNTMRMVEALVQANKQFDWAVYPDKNHGIYGGKTREQLYTKMTQFILNNL